MGTVTLNFLNGFFLMNQLWIPPKNWIVIYRLIVWFFMGNLGFREYWDHLLGKKASGKDNNFNYIHRISKILSCVD